MLAYAGSVTEFHLHRCRRHHAQRFFGAAAARWSCRCCRRRGGCWFRRRHFGWEGRRRGDGCRFRLVLLGRWRCRVVRNSARGTLRGRGHFCGEGGQRSSFRSLAHPIRGFVRVALRRLLVLVGHFRGRAVAPQHLHDRGVSAVACAVESRRPVIVCVDRVRVGTGRNQGVDYRAVPKPRRCVQHPCATCRARSVHGRSRILFGRRREERSVAVESSLVHRFQRSREIFRFGWHYYRNEAVTKHSQDNATKKMAWCFRKTQKAPRTKVRGKTRNVGHQRHTHAPR